MHEMAIGKGILEIALEHAVRYEAKKVITIRLLVGQMAGVESEALRFCFNVQAEGTIAAGAELEIVNVPLVGGCRDCGERFNIEQYRFLCPFCESAAVDILSGRELQVESMEVE